MARLKVLMVEDNALDAELALRELMRADIEFESQRVEGEDAFRQAMAEFKPDIILSDYTMPKFDGLNALDIAHEVLPDTPFIFVSGTIGEEVAIESLKRGASDYILKTNLKRLPSALNFAIERMHEKIANRKLEASLRLRQHAIEASGTPITIVNVNLPNMPLIYVNPAFERVTGYSAEESLGRNCGFLQGTDTDQPELDKIRVAIQMKQSCTALLRNYHKDGRLFLNDLYISPVVDPSTGLVEHFIGIQNDVTQIKRYQADLEHQANYDTLTGLANRNLLKERMQHALTQGTRYGWPFSVAFIDIDNFKLINDSLGHAAGDELIKTLGKRLQACVRDGDTVARLGGDEFVLIITSQSYDESSHFLIQRICSEAAKPIIIDDKELRVTCSIGVASYPGDGFDAERLLANADVAMYRAKSKGRNNFQYYAKEMNAQIGLRLSLESDLWHALDNESLLLHYQPQIDLRTGQTVGMEALIRWQHPRLGMISPMEFIPIAESNGLIISIGQWVIEAACQYNAQLQREGFASIRVAVNLSARQLIQNDLVDIVSNALAVSGLEPRYLELEVTESMVMHNVEEVMQLLTRISDLGVQLSLDDFGTGYSSLAYLKRFPISRLKIDKSFINDLVTDPDDAVISNSIIALGHGLQLKVIAEGIETAEQLAMLDTNGCDEGQGYLFSKPLAAPEMRQLLALRKPFSVE